jgi:hypothetical protein
MEKKYIFLCLSLAAACIVSFLVYMSRNLRREYEKEVKKAFALNSGYEKEILTLEDIRHLPEPVRKYLIYVGVIGQERVWSLKVIADGAIKMNRNSDWTKVNVEQHNFFGDHLRRLFYIKLKSFGIPVYGLHSYTDKNASMLIKIAGLITVADVKGQEMRISDTITLLNDMCLFAPAALIDNRIQWELIDDTTVKALFKTDYCTVSAVLYFNEKGELINFTSEDRYYLEDDGSCRKVKWSTPISDYKERNGLMLASYGEALWNFPESDYCYFKFTNIKETRFNHDDLNQ